MWGWELLRLLQVEIWLWEPLPLCYCSIIYGNNIVHFITLLFCCVSFCLVQTCTHKHGLNYCFCILVHLILIRTSLHTAAATLLQTSPALIAGSFYTILFLISPYIMWFSLNVACSSFSYFLSFIKCTFATISSNPTALKSFLCSRSLLLQV